MSELPCFSCLQTMLLLFSHCSSSHYPVVTITILWNEHLDLSVDVNALYCLSGQLICNLITWNFYVRWDSHKFHIIIELLKVPVDLFALISPRMSFPCNLSWPHHHEWAQTIRQNQKYLNTLQCHPSWRELSQKDTRWFCQLMPCLIQKKSLPQYTHQLLSIILCLTFMNFYLIVIL
jgi:hypothetical protein